VCLEDSEADTDDDSEASDDDSEASDDDSEASDDASDDSSDEDEDGDSEPNESIPGQSSPAARDEGAAEDSACGSCPAEHPLCDEASAECVACLTDGDCDAETPICDATARACRFGIAGGWSGELSNGQPVALFTSETEVLAIATRVTVRYGGSSCPSDVQQGSGDAPIEGLAADAAVSASNASLGWNVHLEFESAESASGSWEGVRNGGLFCAAPTIVSLGTESTVLAAEMFSLTRDDAVVLSDLTSDSENASTSTDDEQDGEEQDGEEQDEECAPGCTLEAIGDGSCDDACDVAACEYDDFDCDEGEEDDQCAPGCDYDELGNGSCEEECNLAACDFDGFDCGEEDEQEPECAPGCNDDIWGDGVCDAECNVAACDFDDFDCEEDDVPETPACPTECDAGTECDGGCSN
jgi:hypothetical protein